MMWWTRVFKDEHTNKPDWHVVLFFINVFLVILSYSSRGALFQVVKAGRLLTLVIGLAGLFTWARAHYRYVFSGNKSWVLWLFILLNLMLLAFSINFTRSLSRIAAWLPFLLYINYFIVYLYRRYENTQVKIKLIQLFCLAYFYPLVILFVFANPLFNRSLYGLVIANFKANVFAWSGAVFFATGVDVLFHLRLESRQKKILIGAIVLALLALTAAGSRSSYLCVAVSACILVFNSKRIRFFSKIGISLFITGATYYMLEDPNSAINKRIQRSEQQLETGEYRFQLAETALETMFENPQLLLTGFGYDSTLEGIAHYTGKTFMLPSHNSYLELFLSTGLFSFAFFLVFLVLNALIRYAIFDVRKFIFLPTFMIIPFFESNLNAGQYLFFPWMTFLFYYVHAGTAQYPIPPRKAAGPEPARSTRLGVPQAPLPQPAK